MTEKPDMDFLSAAMLAGGRSPIQVAELRVAQLLEVRGILLGREANGHPRLPAWQDLSNDALARKVVGLLMDAGWRPPSDAEVEAAAQWAGPTGAGK